MDNMVRGNVLKKIVALLLIMATVMSYFPAGVFATDDNEQSGDGIVDRVELTAAWTSGEEIEQGVAYSSCAFQYVLKLNGTQFQDVNISITTDSVEGVSDSFYSNSITRKGPGYAIISYGNLDSGRSLSDNVSVEFGMADQILDRTVTVVATGKYRDKVTNEYVPFSIRKVLNARIKPYDRQVSPYNANMTWGEGGNSSPQYYRTQYSLGRSEYGLTLGWYATNVTAKYPLYIQSEYLTQQLELKVTIGRTTSGTSKLSEGYTINWDGLEEVLGPATQIDNEDGTITFVFNKGEDTNGLDRANTFKLNKVFNIVITYQTPNTNPVTLGENADSGTSVSFKAELDCKGYKLEREWGQEDVETEITKSLKIYDSHYYYLLEYTPGTHAWISIDSYAASGVTSVNDTVYQYYGSINDDVINELKENRTIDLGTYISCDYTGGDINVETGRLNFRAPELTYTNDAGYIRTITLTADQMKVKSIRESNTYSSQYICGSETEDIVGSYEVENDTNTFSIEMPDFLNKIGRYANMGRGGRQIVTLYHIVYSLNADELGLSDTELENIKEISITTNTSGRWFEGNGVAKIKRVIIPTEVEYSYMKLECDGFDTTAAMQGKKEGKQVRLRMYINSDKIKNNETTLKYVVNKNPVFYVSLPKEFKYSNIDINMTENDNISIDEDNCDIIKDNGVQYLVIPCIGTYDSRKNAEIDITIDYDRTLINGSSQRCNQTAFMLTENENYVSSVSNLHGFTINEVTPDSIYYEGIDFNVVGGSELSATTVFINDGKEYKTDSSNSIVEDGEIEQPILINTNKSLTIRSQIAAYGDSIDNISIMTRVPFKNNVSMYDSSRLIEDNYKLPDTFYERYGSKVRGTTQGESVKQLTSVDLKISGVYKVSNSITTKVDTSQYTIYSTSDPTADYETSMDAFTVCNLNETLTNAKTIKVVFDENYKLNSNEMLYIEYEAIMPDEEGMAGTETAAKYIRNSNNAQEILNSSPMYMINGDDRSDVIVTKKFENYALGRAPEGVSLEGIEFKLQYYNETTGQREFLKDSSDNDIIATTDSTGKARFSNIPAGDYYLYEVTEFTDYSGIGRLNLIYVEPSQVVNYTAINYLKRGNLIVNKQWEDTNDNQGEVTFEISRVNAAYETLTFRPVSATTVNGVATFENIPYGTYVIRETNGVAGWTPEVDSVQAKLDVASKEVDFNNIPGKGILQIVKNVPEGQSVEELSFRVTGYGMMTYINTEGNRVNTNTNMTIRIADENQPENVNVVVSNDKTTATITISNLYLGFYTVDEVDIPTIGNGTPKYNAVSGSAELVNNDLVNPVVISLKNNYKYGYIEINKTAKLKDGDNYIDIGDLSEFKVRVTGTSDYGNAVDGLIQLDEDGYGVGKFEIGEYTITEVAVDGYTTYYGENNEASTEPVTRRVLDGQKITQKLYNEHTGIGYVRVEKSLETVTDPYKVASAGIQFKVYGKNVAGADVEEIININQVDEEKNVAYGISGPISSGGEYELEEITVPEFYSAEENQVVELSTSSTIDNPLVMTAHNPRDKGNLEMVTTTNPEGGPLKNITYRVTRVDISSDGTYTPIAGTTTIVEGSNFDYNASFAKMEDIYAGYYLVEQKDIPAGWIKDVNQIVEVPSEGTGYANFEITKRKTLDPNKVTISKVVLNEDGEDISSEDLFLAKLEARQSFEVKITNVDTLEEYYVFVSDEKPGVIQGLDVGTYKIEEVFKPKYELEGYYKLREIENPIVEADPLIVEDKITATDGVYLFTITEEGNTVQDVSLVVKNKIKTDYGFAGQNQIDNLGITTADEEQISFVTKAIIYVVDEQGNAISGVKFNLVDSQNRLVSVNDSTEITVDNKRLTIKGIPVGVYTLKCTEVPEGYLVPDDEMVVVYSDATQVARVEIQKNIPRGSLTLSTVYSTDNGDLRNVSRSKYKVVDRETGELVKFTRTATGNYKKSNLDDASPVIILKSGNVKVDGIETGDYEVGLVDVTKGYGIKKLNVEEVTVGENQNQLVQVEVINHNIVQVDAGISSNMYVNDDGELYFNGYHYYAGLGDGNGSNYSSMFQKVKFPVSNVKIKKIVHSSFGQVALDTDGRVWMWGDDYFGSTIVGDVNTPQCITEIGILSDAYYKDNTRFVDIEASYGEILLLDNKGVVWAGGSYNGNGSTSMQEQILPVSRFNGLNDVTVKKLGKIKYGHYTTYGVIDTLGRVWTWGSNRYLIGTAIPQDTYYPVCLSIQTDNQNPVTPLKDVVMEDLLFTGDLAMAVDSEGNLWMWGTAGSVQGTVTGTTSIYPTKVDSSFFGGAKIKEIAASSMGTNGSDVVAVIDEYGKVWTWGVGSLGELGNGTTSGFSGYSGTPICISDDENEALYGVKMKYIDISEKYSQKVAGSSYSSTSDGYHVIAVDTNNRIWTWGGFSEYGEAGKGSRSPISIPQNIDTTYNEHFEYNLKYKKIYASGNNYNKIALDDEGRVWVWGENYSNSLGINNRYSSINSPTILEFPDNLKIVKVAAENSNNTLFLSEDGRVFLSGYGYIGDGSKWGGDYGIGLTEITEYFHLQPNEKIVDIHVDESYSPLFIAVDSDGKVYTWGPTSILGRTTSTNSALLIECISDDANEPLYGVKIKKVSSYYNYVGYAISEDGQLYAWKGSVPQLVNSSVKFVDVQREYLLDENGKLWQCDYSTLKLKCMSDIVTEPLYKKYQIDSKYKIVELANHENSGSWILCRDSNGDWWEIRYGTDIYKYETFANDTVSLSARTAIDKYGQIWEKDSSNNVTCLTSSGNPLYNVKISRIINEYYVMDEDGNEWWTPYTGIAKIEESADSQYNYYYQEYVEKTYNVKILQNLDEKYMLDNNGKLWYKKECLSDKAGSALAEAYNDTAFKLSKIYNDNSLYFALANDGSVWQWKDGTTPQRLRDSSGNLLENIQSIEFADSRWADTTIIAKNNNGKIWLWGANGYGQIGDGTTQFREVPYCINQDDTDNKKIKMLKINSYGSIMLCEDDSVYITGKNGDNQIKVWTYKGTCEGATNVFFVSDRIYYNASYTYIISGNNKVWTFGHNEGRDNYCGTSNTTDEYIDEITLISEEFTAVEGSYLDYNIMGVMDSEGNEWIWGYSIPHPRKTSLNHVVTHIVSDGGTVICEDGKIYYLTDYDGSFNYKDISRAIIDIYGELNRENILKIAKILSHRVSSDEKYYEVVDGKAWELSITDDWDADAIVQSYKCLNDTLGSEMKDKYIVQCKDNKAIDSDGNLYVWGQYTGLNFVVQAPKNITKTSSVNDDSNMLKANNAVTNNPIKNGLYGVKVKDIINDKFVIDENDNVWYFTISGNAVNISEENKGDLNPLYGKQIKRKINNSYVATTDGEVWFIGSDYPARVRKDLPEGCEIAYDSGDYSIGLKDGKIWVCGTNSYGTGNGDYTTNGEPVCLNDIEGTELYNATVNDSNFKIKSIVYRYGFSAIDNSGKVWAWGTCKKSGTEGNYELSPVCFTDIEGTELYDAYYNNNITMVDVYLYDNSDFGLVDSEGALWRYSQGEFKYIVETITNNGLPDNFKIAKINKDGTHSMILGTDGTLYSDMGCAYGTYGSLPCDAEDMFSTYYSRTTYSSYYKYDGYCFALDTSGKLYRMNVTWNMNRSNGSVYNRNVSYVEISNIDNVVEKILVSNASSANLIYMLRSSNGQLAIASSNTVSLITSLSGNAISVEKIGNTILITDSNDNLYACLGMSSATVYSPSLFTQYDDIIAEIYGEATNETRKDFVRQLDGTNNGLIVHNGKTYQIKTENSETTCTEINLVKRYINGLGVVQEVVGEYEVLSDDGRIYRLTPDGTTSYTLTEVSEATEFTTQATVVTNPEDASIEVEGKTIVKQSPHKALDSDGNLYVWDEYTGLTTYEQENGTVNLTEKEYDVEPIYLHSNGWTIIKSCY